MMNKTRGEPRSLQIYISINALALLTAGIIMIIIAGGASLSLFHILLISFVFLLAAIVGGLAIMVQMQSTRRAAIRTAIFNSGITTRLTIIFAVLFAAFWCLTWFPVEQTGKLYSYFIGIYPLILCGTLASGLSLIFLITKRDGFSWAVWNRYWHEHRVVLNITLIGLTGICFIAFLIVHFGGLGGPAPYWYGAGVPLLAWQVFIALVIGILALPMETKLFHTKTKVDLALFLFIWIVAAFFWARQPLNQSFWITPRLPPNYEYYPFSDLVVFDVGSQFALIGQGINNHLFFDRALYMSFLVYLHSIGGQNYQHLMAIQAAIYAVFPGLLYLIGRKLHNRIAGIILATLTIFRGSNSLIATTWIYTSTLKHMLTDFPTAIGLAIFTLLILMWLENPQRHWHEVAWAAGILGLTSLLRPHVLLLLPALFLLVFWIYRPRWIKGLALVGLTLAAFLVSVFPWVLLGPANGSVITLYRIRIEDVIRKRYLPGTFIPTHMSALTMDSTKLEMLLPSVHQNIAGSKTTIPFPITCFLHNLVTSVMSFPDSPEFLSVKATVKGGEAFWSSYWNGSMSSTAAGMLVLNLAINSFGFGAAYKRSRWRGFTPLAVFLIYQVANALAHTAGGRYLVPVDWIILVYFGIGLAELLQAGGSLLDRETCNYSSIISSNSQAKEEVKIIWLPRVLGILLALTIIGGTIPLAGYLYPLRYPGKKQSVLLDKIAPYFSALDLSRTNVENFLLKPQAVILEGRVLYPRFYPQDQGEPNPLKPFFKNFSYSRTEFLLIGPHGLDYVILPGGKPKIFPNATDVILLGCENVTDGTYNAASALVVVLPEQAVSYARSPAAPLACPIPEPVCNNNKICH